MKFVDLFAGLGGFHVALQKEDHKCVFASEIDDELTALYKKNFDLRPQGDIRDVTISEIPSHDVLCAGFPCKPFSKAGEQKGADCPRWGDLYEYVIQILNEHNPSYFILENVPNLKKHEVTWKALLAELEQSGGGYAVDDHKLSPHKFGVPQRRHRIFIVGAAESIGGLQHFSWPEPPEDLKPNIRTVLDSDSDDPDTENVLTMPEHYVPCMELWQEFMEKHTEILGESKSLPSFPVWAMEFGATYDYEDTTPYAKSIRAGEGPNQSGEKGSFGEPLKGSSWEEVKDGLPSHATREQEKFPQWKIQYIRQNRELGEKLRQDKEWFGEWLQKIKEYPTSLQKFEWNCKGENRKIWNHIIQFRASGVRVKRPTTAPSLVAMTTTQVPIIGWEKRYMTRRECARLQSLDSLEHLPNTNTSTFKALGNAVNATVVRCIAANLLSKIPDDHTQKVLHAEGIIAGHNASIQKVMPTKSTHASGQEPITA